MEWTNTDLERSGYPHYVGTPVEVSGKAWGFLENLLLIFLSEMPYAILPM